MVNTLDKGNLLIIKSINRLGRYYDEILVQCRKITKEIETDFLVIDMPLLDTRDKNHDATGKLISDIVLQLLTYVAETERNNIRQRQREGIDSAKARGVRFRGQEKERPVEYELTYYLWKQGEIFAREAGKCSASAARHS